MDQDNDLSVVEALERAFLLGQLYWQQADSEYVNYWRKAEETKQNFLDLKAQFMGENSE